MTKLFAQGDVILERVDDIDKVDQTKLMKSDPDGAIVLAYGEITGHRHAFYGGQVLMFRDDGLARDIPSDLYIGHVKISGDGASLQHEEHDTINLTPGTYRIRRQREFDAGEVKIVAD